MTVYVLYMTDQVLSNDARWQNALLYKCCYLQAASESISKRDKCAKGIKGRKGEGRKG
jgi:hypothetical protein